MKIVQQQKANKDKIQTERGKGYHSTGKDIFTQIDNLGGFAYTPSCEVEKPIKDIGMSIVEANPV